MYIGFHAVFLRRVLSTLHLVSTSHRTMADPLLKAKQLLAAAVAPTAAPAAVRPPSPSPSPPF